MNKYDKQKAPSNDRASWQRFMVLTRVIRVRLELTANGLKGQCSLFYCSR